MHDTVVGNIGFQFSVQIINCRVNLFIMPWEMIKENLAAVLPESTMNLWIHPLVFRKESDQLFELVAPDRFFCSWVKENFLADIGKSLKNLDFLVVQDIFLSETAQLAHVVLPASAFAERDGTFTNTERRVQKYRSAMKTPGVSLPDWKIVCDIAEKMGTPMNFESASDIMDEIAALTPIYHGISYDRIDEVGLQWPCTDLDHKGTTVLHQDSQFLEREWLRHFRRPRFHCWCFR